MFQIILGLVSYSMEEIGHGVRHVLTTLAYSSLDSYNWDTNESKIVWENSVIKIGCLDCFQRAKPFSWRTDTSNKRSPTERQRMPSPKHNPIRSYEVKQEIVFWAFQHCKTTNGTIGINSFIYCISEGGMLKASSRMIYYGGYL